MQRKSPKSTTAFEYIRQKIRSGEWQVGDKIPSEAALTSRLNISRSTLRDVIAQYIALGILRSEKGRGTFVVDDQIEALTGTVSEKGAEVAPPQIRDNLEFRLLIEPEGLKKALERGPERIGRLVAELEKCTAKMEESVGRPADFIAADISFHILIAEATGNRVFADCLRFLFEKTLTQQKQVNSLFGFQDGLRFHKKILEYIKNGDYPKAVRELKAHIAHAVNALDHKS